MLFATRTKGVGARLTRLSFDCCVCMLVTSKVMVSTVVLRFLGDVTCGFPPGLILALIFAPCVFRNALLA